MLTLQDGFYFADGAKYMAAARHIAEHGSFPLNYDRAPLYPVFLAGLHAVVGESFLSIRLVQACMGALIAVLIALIGRRMGGKGVGAVAGILWAIYPMGTFISGTIYPTTLLTFLLALAVCSLMRETQQGAATRCALAGLLFGLSALAKPIVLATIPLAAIWIVLVSKDGRFARFAIFLIAVLIALLPWSVWNAQIHGRVVPIESRSLETVVPWAAPAAANQSKPKLKRLTAGEEPHVAVMGPLREPGEKESAAQAQQVVAKQPNPETKKPRSEAGAPQAAVKVAQAGVAQSPADRNAVAPQRPAPKAGDKPRPKQDARAKPERAPPQESALIHSKVNLDMIKRMLARAPGEFLSFFELYPRRVGYLHQEERDRAIFKKNNKQLVRYTKFGSDPVMLVSIFSVGSLYLMALVGVQSMVRLPGARLNCLLLFIMFMSFAVGYSISWGKIRYRVPVDPYIIILSAWGVVYLWSKVFRQPYSFTDAGREGE